MRRLSKRVMLLALAASLLCALAMSAMASGSDYVVVSVDSCIEGNEYALLLVKPGASVSALNDSDILFINQYTATSAGKLKAAILIPGLEKFDVYAGGTFSDGNASPWKRADCETAHLPGDLNAIDEEAFANSAFTHVYLGDQVTSIGARAFAGCANLAYVYIPSSVTGIAADAFADCDNVVIGCDKDSKAKEFAQTNGVEFCLLGN